MMPLFYDAEKNPFSNAHTHPPTPTHTLTHSAFEAAVLASGGEDPLKAWRSCVTDLSLPKPTPCRAHTLRTAAAGTIISITSMANLHCTAGLLQTALC